MITIILGDNMGKKKREHIVFDQILKTKKSIPFSIVNRQNTEKKSRIFKEK